VRTLDDVFNEALALNKTHSKDSKSHSIIGMGVKIQKFRDSIEILNTNKGGGYYKECSDEEYNIFCRNGWEKGCIHIAISNCLHKLSLIEESIKTEVNTRKNDKHIKNLKSKRDDVLLKHASYKLKLK